MQRCESSFSEVVIVDNASTDGSAEEIEGLWPQVSLIRNQDNRGLASGNNQGIAATTGEYVIICNPDLVFTGNTIGELVRCLERRPRAAIVGGRMLTPEGGLHTSVGDLPRLRDAMLGTARTGPYWWTQWSHDEERAVGHVLEACYAVRRAAIEEVGPQDAGFFMNWEGLDWAARFAARGWETWFCPSAEVIHVGGVSVKQVQWRWEVWSHRSMYRYFRRHSRVPAPLLGSLIAVRTLIKALAVLVRGGRTLPPLVSADKAVTN